MGTIYNLYVSRNLRVQNRAFNWVRPLALYRI